MSMFNDIPGFGQIVDVIGQALGKTSIQEALRNKVHRLRVLGMGAAAFANGLAAAGIAGANELGVMDKAQIDEWIMSRSDTEATAILLAIDLFIPALAPM